MKHIVFTIDHKFVLFCAVTMVSILKNDTPSDITVHVVANGLYGFVGFSDNVWSFYCFL